MREPVRGGGKRGSGQVLAAVRPAGRDGAAERGSPARRSARLRVPAGLDTERTAQAPVLPILSNLFFHIRVAHPDQYRVVVI